MLMRSLALEPFEWVPQSQGSEKVRWMRAKAAHHGGGDGTTTLVNALPAPNKRFLVYLRGDWSDATFVEFYMRLNFLCTHLPVIARWMK